jgi:hypothetical protein
MSGALVQESVDGGASSLVAAAGAGQVSRGCGGGCGCLGCQEDGSSSMPPCRRRAWIQGRGCLGCGPNSVASYSPQAVSVFCGPFQSRCAMEFPSASGSTAAAGVSLFRRGFLESSACKGSRDLVVIFTFPRAVCESRVGQLSSVFLYGILVRVRVLYVFLNY